MFCDEEIILGYLGGPTIVKRVLLLIREERESEPPREDDVTTEIERFLKGLSFAVFENRGRGHEPKNIDGH